MEQEERIREETESLIRGTGVNLLTLLAKLVRPLFYFVAARLYGAESYGLYFLAWMYIELLSRLASLGLDRGMLRYIAYYNSLGENHLTPACFRTALYVSSFLSLGTGTILFFSAEPLSLLLHNNALALPIKWLAFTLFFQTASGLFVHVSIAWEVMKYQFYFKGLLEPLLLLGLSVLLFLGGFGLKGLCAAHFLTMAVVFLCSAFSALKYFPLRLWFDRSVGFHRKIVRFSLSIFLADAIASINARLDVILLGALASPQIIGIYGLMTQLAEAMQKARFVFEPIANPIFTAHYARKEMDRLGDTLKLVTRWMTIITIFLALFLVLFGNEIIALAGQDYRMGYPWLLTLIPGAMAYCLLGMSGYLLAMAGYPDTLLLSNLISLLVSGTCTCFLIHLFGPLGAATGTAFTLILTHALASWWVFRRLKIHPFAPALYKPLIAGFLAALFLNLLTPLSTGSPMWNILAHLPFLLVFYGGFLVCFGLEAEERRLCIGIFYKTRGIRRQRPLRKWEI